MVKANLTLPNGTTVEIEGTPAEVQELLAFYGGGNSAGPPAKKKSRSKGGAGKKATRKGAERARAETEEGVDITEIVNLVKGCDEAEDIEARILDKSSQVDRTLLPLYIVHEHLGNAHALSSGDVNKVTTQLSVPVATANASKTLSGTASRYVIGDSARRQGSTVRYKLNRRGLKYLSAVIAGESGD